MWVFNVGLMMLSRQWFLKGVALQHRKSTGQGVTPTRLSRPAQPVSNVLTWKFISLSYNIPNHKIRGLIKSQGSCQSPMFWAFSFSKNSLEVSCKKAQSMEWLFPLLLFVFLWPQTWPHQGVAGKCPSTLTCTISVCSGASIYVFRWEKKGNGTKQSSSNLRKG